MVRRLPQLAAGLAALALLGTAVGAEATISSGAPALVAVPAAQVVAPAVEAPAAQVVDDALSVAEISRAAQQRAAAEAKKKAEADEKAEAKKKAEADKKAEAEKKTKEKAEAEAEAKAQAEEKAEADKKAAAEQKAAAEKKAAEDAAASREERASRSSGRAALDASQLGAGAGKRWTTVALNARSAPDAGAALVDVLDAGDQLAITERTSGSWRQVELGGKAAWVAEKYLVDRQPKKASAPGGGAKAGVSGGACPSGSSVEAGLQPNAVAVHRAVCAAFPSITSYGGVRADSVPGHPEGRAIDAMIPNYSGSGNALGWQVAEYVRANASRLGVTEVIFDQKIWTTQRSGEGWRSMGNRGGDTANHRDHVHVTVR
ncbi:SH3 domain-containing protein [Auraticoccus monumenti]|uniref:SH3 domain-containing protein n=1 Tax=Auraticoccus monumenti TaxID=675864 RepID=A0A1G6VGI0_9ACTN|nr:SH3 domain-containing protein [Auraticoccus monumenti]